MTDEERTTLEQELSDLRRQFGRMLIDDHEPDLADRLDTFRQRIADIKHDLATAAAANRGALAS